MVRKKNRCKVRKNIARSRTRKTQTGGWQLWVVFLHPYPSHFFNHSTLFPSMFVFWLVIFPIKELTETNHCLTIAATRYNEWICTPGVLCKRVPVFCMVCRYVADVYELFYRRKTLLLATFKWQSTYECCFAHSLAIMTTTIAIAIQLRTFRTYQQCMYIIQPCTFACLHGVGLQVPIKIFIVSLYDIHKQVMNYCFSLSKNKVRIEITW